MSYWQIPEDMLYSILDIDPQGYNPDDVDRKMPRDLPKTDETREVFYEVMSDSDNFGKVESAVERVLDDTRSVAKSTIDDYLVSKGVDPVDVKRELWYTNMSDDFAHETLFGIRGGDPEYYEISSTYLPAMFEYLEEPEDETLFNVVVDESYRIGQASWKDWVESELREIRNAAIEAVKTSPAAWSEDQWKEAMDNGIVMLYDDLDQSYSIYYEGHIIEQAVRSDDVEEYAREIAAVKGLDPEKSIFSYNSLDDGLAGDVDDENSMPMSWTPQPKPDPRQQTLEFAASASSYRGTPKKKIRARHLPQYSEVTEKELMNAINESEIKIEMLEEAGNLPAAREEKSVLDELLAMYGDDEYVDDEASLEDEDDYHFYSTGVYPDESTQTQTPPWLQDELAREFGE